jgi:hypothetical protein
VGYLIDVAIGAAGSLLAAEIWSHAEPLARWLVRRAVRRLPEAQRERRQEEWLAHLEETPGAVRKLLHGVGCWSGAPAVGRAVAGRVRQRARTVFILTESGEDAVHLQRIMAHIASRNIEVVQSIIGTRRGRWLFAIGGLLAGAGWLILQWLNS